MPEPNQNDRRPTRAGEAPLQAAPPVPGAMPLPSPGEQRLGPAPAVPISGGWAAAGPGSERPLAAAPAPRGPAVPVGRENLAQSIPLGGERQIAPAPAPIAPSAFVPVAGPARPGSPERPLAGVGAGPIGARPEGPLARPGEPYRPGWPPASVAPPSGYAPVPGVAPQVPTPVAGPVAPYGNAPVAGMMPAAGTSQPYALGQPNQPTPPAGPAWFQPPANPPPVPPPSAGSTPPEPPSPRPIDWSPHARSGPVGSAVTSAIAGHVGQPTSKTSTAKSLRRESRVRSSMLALTFLFVAAAFLIGMLVILLITLAS